MMRFEGHPKGGNVTKPTDDHRSSEVMEDRFHSLKANMSVDDILKLGARYLDGVEDEEPEGEEEDNVLEETVEKGYADDFEDLYHAEMNQSDESFHHLNEGLNQACYSTNGWGLTEEDMDNGLNTYDLAGKTILQTEEEEEAKRRATLKQSHFEKTQRQMLKKQEKQMKGYGRHQRMGGPTLGNLQHRLVMDMTADGDTGNLMFSQYHDYQERMSHGEGVGRKRNMMDDPLANMNPVLRHQLAMNARQNYGKQMMRRPSGEDTFMLYDTVPRLSRGGDRGRIYEGLEGDRDLMQEQRHLLFQRDNYGAIMRQREREQERELKILRRKEKAMRLKREREQKKAQQAVKIMESARDDAVLLMEEYVRYVQHHTTLRHEGNKKVKKNDTTTTITTRLFAPNQAFIESFLIVEGGTERQFLSLLTNAFLLEIKVTKQGEEERQRQNLLTLLHNFAKHFPRTFSSFSLPMASHLLDMLTEALRQLQAAVHRTQWSRLKIKSRLS